MDAVKKTDMFLVPFSKLVINHSDNGRFAPHTKEEIEKLAEDIALHGQQQPVGVKRIKGTDQYKLVFGFGRATAVQYANSKRDEDEQIPVKAIIVNQDTREQFLCNISENVFHKAPTDMDHAHNIRRLKMDFGLTFGDIAVKYGKSLSWVNQRMELNDLHYEAKMNLHKGLISFSDALDMARNMSEEEQAQVAATVQEVEKAVEAEQAKQAESSPISDPVIAAKTTQKAAATKKNVVRKAAKQAVAAVRKQTSTPASAKTVGNRSTSEMKDFLHFHMKGDFPKQVRDACGILLDGWEGKMREQDEFSARLVSAILGEGVTAFAVN